MLCKSRYVVMGHFCSLWTVQRLRIIHHALPRQLMVDGLHVTLPQGSEFHLHNLPIQTFSWPLWPHLEGGREGKVGMPWSAFALEVYRVSQKNEEMFCTYFLGFLRDENESFAYFSIALLLQITKMTLTCFLDHF